MEPYELGQLQETIRAAIIDGLRQDESAARLARIDETARAIFVAVKAAALQPNSPYDLEDMAGYAIECYADALAIERARDEAIRELDTPPPGGAK